MPGLHSLFEATATLRPQSRPWGRSEDPFARLLGGQLAAVSLGTGHQLSHWKCSGQSQRPGQQDVRAQGRPHGPGPAPPLRPRLLVPRSGPARGPRRDRAAPLVSTTSRTATPPSAQPTDSGLAGPPASHAPTWRDPRLRANLPGAARVPTGAQVSSFQVEHTQTLTFGVRVQVSMLRLERLVRWPRVIYQVLSMSVLTLSCVVCSCPRSVGGHRGLRTTWCCVPSLPEKVVSCAECAHSFPEATRSPSLPGTCKVASSSVSTAERVSDRWGGVRPGRKQQ